MAGRKRSRTEPVVTAATAYDPLECPLLTPPERERMHHDHGWSGQRIGRLWYLDAQASWDLLTPDMRARFIQDTRDVARQLAAI